MNKLIIKSDITLDWKHLTYTIWDASHQEILELAKRTFESNTYKDQCLKGFSDDFLESKLDYYDYGKLLNNLKNFKINGVELYNTIYSEYLQILISEEVKNEY